MHEPRLCVTVAARTIEELRRARDAVRDADLVELRLDALHDAPDVAGALQGRRTPVIVTCRAQFEGGWFKGSEEERRRVLELAMSLGAEYIDVEAAASFAPDLVRSRSGRGVIVSTHLFGEPPNDIASRYAALRATGAEILKLAIEVSRLEQTLPLFELAKHVEPRQRHVLIAMGGAGVPTRVLAGRLGSQWTYGGDGVAPGQLPASRLLYDFRFRRVAANAALYGVVGNPILHSLSPAMHNAGFAALGLNAVYVPLEAKDADDFVRFAKGVGLNGASITAPFKVALMPHVDEIDPLARRVGAINTVMAQNGRWIGTNTDVDGFLTPLEKRIRLEGARVSVLGAGGAARAAAFALASRKAEVTICARRAGEAAAIARLVNGKTGEFPPPGSSWDVLVNATSGGTLADPANPIEGARLDGRVVFDLVYAPAETALLDAAREAGCQTIGGIEMLIAQAERQFELWTGQRPPVGLFEASSRRVLAEGPHEGSPQGAPRQTEKNAANHIRPVR